MRSVFLLFSHCLTVQQIHDLKQNWNVENIVPLPNDLQEHWSNISPEAENISYLLTELKSWLLKNADTDDLVLISGDFGAVYEIVNFCKKSGFMPIYATTERQIKETTQKDGKVLKKSIFMHVRFRAF